MSEDPVSAAAADLDLLIVILNGFSGLNNVGHEINADQLRAAEEALEDARESLLAAGEPELAEGLPKALPKVASQLTWKGRRMREKVQAGRAAAQVRRLRKVLPGDPPPRAWHDAEMAYRLSPISWLLSLGAGAFLLWRALES